MYAPAIYLPLCIAVRLMRPVSCNVHVFAFPPTLHDACGRGRQDFSGAIAKEVNFSGSDLRGVRFFKADLKKANFSGANLGTASLEEADLDG